MNKLEANLRIKHMERLVIEDSVPWNLPLYIRNASTTTFEKIGDCCDNIANKVLDDINIKEAEAKEN